MSNFYAYPGTTHPALEHIADSVRGYMAQGQRQDLVYAIPPKPTALFARPGEERSIEFDTFRTKTMAIQKCWGPVPHVGRPFAYIWRAAVDDAGRWVAQDDVELVYMMEPWEFDWKLAEALAAERDENS